MSQENADQNNRASSSSRIEAFRGELDESIAWRAVREARRDPEKKAELIMDIRGKVMSFLVSAHEGIQGVIDKISKARQETPE